MILFSFVMLAPLLTLDPCCRNEEIGKTVDFANITHFANVTHVANITNVSCHVGSN